MSKDNYGRDLEDVKALRAKMELANQEARDNWDDPQWRREMAADLTEQVYEGFTHENLLGILAETENAGFDDRIFVKEVRGLRAHWIARGGYIEASTLRANVMELPRHTIGFHVMEFEDKLLTNFSETQATLVNLAIQVMDAEVNSLVFRMLQQAIPQGSDYYLSHSGLDLDQLNQAIREVRDETNQFDVSIVGRSTMTDQIQDLLLTSNSVGFLPATSEEISRNGKLGTYRGAQIVTLRNFKDDQNESFFPANELFVVAKDASKFAFWGGLKEKEWIENDNWYWHFAARRDFGGVVHRPERLRRIVDTNQAP